LQLLIDTMDGMECVGVYNDCRDVIKHVKTTSPDVILMDIDMPYVDGVSGVREIRKHYPDVKILMQTVFEDNDKIFAAICAGADGYLLKQASPIALLEAIKEVLEDGAPMTPIIAKKVLKLFTNPVVAKAQENFNLTKRETEVLILISKGYSYKMIANECNVSYSTVNTHISNIYEKLQVESAAGAVSIAIREGLIK
jgi:DNA-binding NarL/FixJ family response regulator